MKKLSLYLHQDIIDVLLCFGEVNDVINRILEEFVNKNFLFDNLIPKARDRNGARRINVFIKLDTLSQLLGVGVRSIVYWFVENEVYSDLNWEAVSQYRDNTRLKCMKQFDKVLAELNKLNTMCNVDDIIDAVERMRNET